MNGTRFPLTKPDALSGFAKFLLPASTHFGVPTGTMYQLINGGEISHVLSGSRRYVSVIN